MNKTIILFIFLFVIVIGYFINYNDQYNVEHNKKSIQTYVKNDLNETEDIDMNPQIIAVNQLGDSSTFIATFKLSSREMGFAALIKGINNKMKINRIRYGDNKVSYSTIKTNNGNYGVVTGSNQGLKVDHIKVNLMNEKYSFVVNVSKNQYFTKYKKLPKKINNPIHELIYYDVNNNVLP